MASNLIDMRLLEVRSGVFFEYPKFSNVDKNIMFFLPFWENPVITEAKEARIVEYNPINRGSTLFTHVGANSRNLTIEFNLTVPHIMKSINSVLNSKKLVEHLSTEKEKERFNSKNPFEGTIPTTRAEDNINLWKTLVIENNAGSIGGDPGEDISSFHRVQNPNLFGGTTMRARNDGGDPNFVNQAAADYDRGFSYNPNAHEPDMLANAFREMAPDQSGSDLRYVLKPEAEPEKKGGALNAINTAVYILEIIRSCVAGNAKTSVLGPPILRLRHGAAYNDVPMICRDYNISIIEEAGYDLKTLIPNRMVITLNTSEIRTGDFGTFKPGKWMRRDNVAGYEAVFEHGSADPGYLK